MPTTGTSRAIREAGEPRAIRSVLLIVNPRSGRGRAGRIGAEMAGAIGAAGLEVQRIDIGTPEAAQLAVAAGEAADPAAAAEGGTVAAVIVGGDGTVHSCASLLARAGIPLYHVPTGTENLFARQFRMRASAAAVMGALRRGRTLLVDVGECAPVEAGAWANGAQSHGEVQAEGTDAPRPFLVVGSIGFDAGVIHRLAAARRGAISHLSYIAPIAREFMGHRAPALSITVDGRRTVTEARGLAIVANSRQYAMRLDPAHRAEMNDGLLDLVFFPATRLTSVSAWAVLSRLRVHHRRRALIAARGREIRVQAADGRAVLQLDGEAIGKGEATDGAWRFDVRPNALRVLA